MDLTYAPEFPWSWATTAAVGLAVLLMLGQILRGGRAFGDRLWARLTVFLLSVAAAALLAWAAWNPLVTPEAQSPEGHLAVAIDVSESVLRAEGGWPAIRSNISTRLQQAVAVLPSDLRERGTASIVTFGSGAPLTARGPRLPLAQLPEAFRQLDRSDFALGTGSDLAAGLEAAADKVADAGGRGAVVLISDGNETTVGAFDAAMRLAQRGIPIFVLPVASRGPEVAIASADLPRRVEAATRTFLRGSLYNGRPEAVRTTLAVEENAGLQDSTARQIVASIPPQEVNLLADGWARLRVPLQFTAAGLQFVDVILTAGQSAVPHRRRLFTHVVEPPRILAVGGDLRWLDLLPSGFAEVTVVAPEQIGGDLALDDFDALVIGGVPADQFPGETLAGVAEAIKEGGLGMLLVNGTHTGDEQAATVLKSYAETPLDDLLPVSSQPRDYQKEPPKRQIVILIDSSGSMDGIKIELAKDIARYIVQDLMRAEDRLHLLTFTSGASHLVQGRNIDSAGEVEALRQIDGIASGGGTDPTAALSIVAGLDLGSDCGMVFISDGEFSPVSIRPECRATVFAIGWDSVPADSPLYAFADPIPVPPGFDPADITIPYFEPEKRKKYWEPGSFTPLLPGGFKVRDQLPVPALSLAGAAVSYLKEDADLAAVRPRFADPVLAYREAGAGYVGVFTSAFPDQWRNDAAAGQAVAAWIERVLPYQARDRYDFRVEDRGPQMAFEIAVIADGPAVAAVDQLEARIELPGAGNVPLQLKPLRDSPATFTGSVIIPRSEQTQRATLILRERGTDALARPQRVPVLVPPADDVSAIPAGEAYSYGLNQTLLQALADAGQGACDPSAGTAFLHAQSLPRTDRPLWPWLTVAALVAYMAAIVLRRLDL